MLELQIEPCQRDEVDQLIRTLEETGAVSISMMDQRDNPILEPKPGETPLWDHLVIHALYSDEDDAHDEQNLLSVYYPHLTQTLCTLADLDWERVCLENFVPQRFGHRLWVCPSWLTPPEPEQVNVILDPGLAFGTGTHPTTSLCLTWLDGTCVDGKTIIDYGCGSGILALAALKLGAHHAYAVDIDEQALLATQQNATSNQITTEALTIGHPTILEAPVDTLIANILLSPLLALQQTFHQLLCPEGRLVVSGLFASQADILIDAYQLSFTHESTVLQDEWALLTFSPQV